MQRAAVNFQRGHDRDLALGQCRDKRVLFQDLLIRPALGAVELGDQRRPVFHARLIDAVLIAVEGEQAAVSAQTDTVQSIQYGIRCKC
jgi:hypothetical protein